MSPKDFVKIQKGKVNQEPCLTLKNNLNQNSIVDEHSVFSKKDKSSSFNTAGVTRREVVQGQLQKELMNSSDGFTPSHKNEPAIVQDQAEKQQVLSFEKTVKDSHPNSAMDNSRIVSMKSLNSFIADQHNQTYNHLEGEGSTRKRDRIHTSKELKPIICRKLRQPHLPSKDERESSGINSNEALDLNILAQNRCRPSELKK